MNLDLTYIHSSLKAKWFKIETKGNDYFCRFYINSHLKTKVRAKVGGFSRRKYKTYPDLFLSMLWKNLYFDDKCQFLDFLECPYTKEEYQNLLLQKEKIRSPQNQ